MQNSNHLSPSSSLSPRRVVPMSPQRPTQNLGPEITTRDILSAGYNFDLLSMSHGRQEDRSSRSFGPGLRGNTSFGNIEPENISSGNIEPENTSSGNVEPENTSSGNVELENTSSGNGSFELPGNGGNSGNGRYEQEEENTWGHPATLPSPLSRLEQQAPQRSLERPAQPRGNVSLFGGLLYHIRSNQVKIGVSLHSNFNGLVLSNVGCHFKIELLPSMGGYSVDLPMGRHGLGAFAQMEASTQNARLGLEHGFLNSALNRYTQASLQWRLTQQISVGSKSYKAGSQFYTHGCLTTNLNNSFSHTTHFEPWAAENPQRSSQEAEQTISRLLDKTKKLSHMYHDIQNRQSTCQKALSACRKQCSPYVTQSIPKTEPKPQGLLLRDPLFGLLGVLIAWLIASFLKGKKN